MTNYYYFDPSGQKLGPINDQQLQALAAQGMIMPESPLETDTGHNGLAGQIPGLNFASPAPSPNPFAAPAPSPNPFTVTGAAQTATNTPSLVSLPTAKNLDNYYRRYSVSAVSVTLLALVMSIMPIMPVIILFFVNIVIWAVCWCLLLYNLWKLVPVGIARTTPGKAVGLSMIPFYNFYWIFVSVLGLCKDTNTILRQHGIRYRINEGMGTIYCILFCASLLLGTIPVLGTLIDMAGCAVGIILFKSLVESGTALLEQRNQPSFMPEANNSPAAMSSSIAPGPAVNVPATAPSPGSSSVFQSLTSAVKGAMQTTPPSALCADCNAEAKNGEFLAYCLPENVRRGKESLCPNCVEKYAIICPKCGFDWRVNVGKGLFDCPICDLAQAVGNADISYVLHQAEASLSRLPQVSSKEDVVTVVGAIYRRGHPKYLDPMGGLLVLTKTGCYFLGPIDPDAPDMGHRDILMPFASIITVSALGDGVHAQKRQQGLSHSLATVTEVTHSAAKTIPIIGGIVQQAGAGNNNPPPKNRLTIAYKESGRVTVMFDIIDVTNEVIEKTAAQFRKQFLGFASQFGVEQKVEAPQQAPASAPSAQEPAGEKYRVFRAGKLLGMITAGEIEAKYAAKALQDADFVLLPLETFLAEIVTPDQPFQLFRDGKRIDQYTLQQIKELHGGGQTQPIDHVLVTMPVFLKRKQQATMTHGQQTG